MSESFPRPTDDRFSRYESLRAALDLIDQGFTLVDRDLRFVAWNKTFLRLLDFPPEMGYVGAPFESFIRHNAERGDYGPGDAQAQIDERMQAARSFAPHEIERTRPNGMVLRVRGVPVPGHGFVTLYSDVTAQRSAERQIREHSAMLETRVAERTAELQRSVAMLVQAQKMEALGQLTGGLAHDFNNILTVVLGNLGALLQARRGDATVAEFAEPAVQAARRGADLIKALLSFSRQQPLRAQATDVAALIGSVGALVRPSLPESLQLDIATVAADAADAGPAAGAPADIVLATTPLWAWIDANQLQNTLLNLILNARDAIPAQHPVPGRIELRADAQALDAAQAAALQMAPGDFVRISVIDNGSGMDSGTLARVFEPFFTTKRPGLGTGLGLAMVYGFVRQSGGAISLSSVPGQGTTVSLWLPACAAAEDGPLSADEGREVSAGARGLALLVEDDAAVRQVVRRQLLELGFAVIEAENGAEAMQILAQTPGIALLLSDVVMPGGIDGRELAAHARGVCGVARVVLMSGYAPDATPAPASPGLRGAPVPMLSKPFTQAQLAALLQGPAE